MTPAEALQTAQMAGRLDRFRLSRHCINERMPDRNVKREDIRKALMTSTKATHEEKAKWRIDGGHDIDGDPLTVIAALEDDTIIITIF